MRLINARTFEFEEVTDETVKKYAILSHRWEEGEVSFEKVQDLAAASKMAGFSKFRRTCEEALGDSVDYVWVDICCIDKKSSAELSEAINSMFRWYQGSTLCYAFLSDVVTGPDDMDGQNIDIRASLWFTHGWTLQEVITPERVVFYDRNWHILGTKQTWVKALTGRTGIDRRSSLGSSLL